MVKYIIHKNGEKKVIDIFPSSEPRFNRIVRIYRLRYGYPVDESNLLNWSQDKSWLRKDGYAS